MFKRICIFSCLVIIAINVSVAQSNGMLPLTGLRYFNEGLSAKTLDVKIDGQQLLNNRIPLAKEMEISILQPAGFKEENNKTIFAAAELVLLSPKGDVLSKIPNLLAKSEITGITSANSRVLGLKFSLTPDMLKLNTNATIKIRLYDLRSKSQMRLEMPIAIMKPGEIIQLSKFAKTLNPSEGVNGIISGLKAKKMLVSVDTTISVAPKMAYTSIDISTIEGSSISGIFSGKESFWVYDTDLNEVKITDILLKQVKGAMENNNVDYTLKIPYRLKNNATKLYTVRYRWESPDKKQVIDVVVRI